MGCEAMSLNYRFLPIRELEDEAVIKALRVRAKLKSEQAPCDLCDYVWLCKQKGSVPEGCTTRAGRFAKFGRLV